MSPTIKGEWCNIKSTQRKYNYLNVALGNEGIFTIYNYRNVVFSK